MRLAIIFGLIALGSAVDIHIDKEKFDAALSSTGDRSSRFLEDIINNLLEQLRELMRNGSENIPVLDPLTINSIRVDENLIGIPGSFIELNNLTAVNLSDFVIDTLRIEVQGIIFQTYTITFDGYIPEILFNTASYDMFLRIFGGDIYGTGDMSLILREPRIKGVITASLRTNNGLFLNMNTCDIAISLGDFEPAITGFWGDETTSLFVSQFLRNLIPELLQFFEVEINDFVSSTALTVGNEILGNFDLIDIIRP